MYIFVSDFDNPLVFRHKIFQTGNYNKNYRMQKNTLTSFLDLLNVKYTPSFTTKHLNEHPHKYNLYGLSEMLSDYGVENVATKIEDKENSLFNIELPFTFTNTHINTTKNCIHFLCKNDLEYFILVGLEWTY